MRPLSVAFRAGKRRSAPCSFSHTVQVKPCTASVAVTDLTLGRAVKGRKDIEREREREREREKRREEEEERRGSIINRYQKSLYSLP